ncbi:MAG: hypothetical protein J0H29_09630 [Sphingobacteriales bacterium]|nr:hypothetical protein [Sphingobacteriales bacterium]
MVSIIIATTLLALFHALIPNHWLPLVAISKAEKWGKPDLVLVAPILLILFGLIYFSINLPHHHYTANGDIKEYKQKSKRKWILIFALMMFLSPCLEVEGLFLASGAYGWDNVLLLALVYT